MTGFQNTTLSPFASGEENRIDCVAVDVSGVLRPSRTRRSFDCCAVGGGTQSSCVRFGRPLSFEGGQVVVRVDVLFKGARSLCQTLVSGLTMPYSLPL